MLQASSLSFHRHTFSAREASSAMPYLNKNDLERDWIDGTGAGVDCTIDIVPLALKACVCVVEEWNCLLGKLHLPSHARSWMKTSRESMPWYDGTGFDRRYMQYHVLALKALEHFTCLSIQGSLCAKTILCSSYKSFFGSLCVSNNYTIYVQVVQNSTS